MIVKATAVEVYISLAVTNTMGKMKFLFRQRTITSIGTIGFWPQPCVHKGSFCGDETLIRRARGMCIRMEAGAWLQLWMPTGMCEEPLVFLVTAL